MPAILIYMTCRDAAEGERIAAALLGKRLIACANIMSPHRSLYRWKGKIETGDETAVIMKTRAALFPEAERAIREIHSYECPCIVALPVSAGHAPFLDWIGAETVR